MFLGYLENHSERNTILCRCPGASTWSYLQKCWRVWFSLSVFLQVRFRLKKDCLDVALNDQNECMAVCLTNRIKNKIRCDLIHALMSMLEKSLKGLQRCRAGKNKHWVVGFNSPDWLNTVTSWLARWHLEVGQSSEIIKSHAVPFAWSK